MYLDITIAIYIFIVVMIGYTIQTISGFGSIIFALPLAMIFIDKLEILPVLLFMSIFQSFAVAYRDRKHIIIKEFIIMFSLAIIGIPIGIWIGHFVLDIYMNIALGVFIILNSIYSLYTTFKDIPANKTMKVYHRFYPIISGLLQTVYGIGGPMIAAYMDKVTRDKRAYRSMLSLYWCLINPFIIIGYLTRGEINSNHFSMLILLVPAVILGLLIGNKTIDKISEKKFRIFVHSLLICIGFTLFV